MARREFTPTVYAEIVRRATNPKLGIVCEGCGLVLDKKPWNIDHTIPDAMHIDKSEKLTAQDGKLLGVECCHDPKTTKDKGDIARAKRREGRHLGFQKSKSRPMPGTKASGIRKRMDGTIERW